MLKFDRLAIDVAQFSWLRKKRWQPLLTDISLAVQPVSWWRWSAAAGKAKVCFCRVRWDCCRIICAAGVLSRWRGKP